MFAKKKLGVTVGLFLLGLSQSGQAVEERTIAPITNGCDVVSKNGSMDIWACKDSPGKYICYVTYNCDGSVFTEITNWCTSSSSDCW